MKPGRRHDRRLLSSEDAGENSLPFPIDLLIQIFLRLTVKCVARCRCVSKLWDCLLGLPHFTELFLTRSMAQPRLLFACRNVRELCFFSSPQTQKASPVSANQHMKFSFEGSTVFSGQVRGLVCFEHIQRISRRRNASVPVIINPSMGQSFSLPKVSGKKSVFCFFGYDPVQKQFKVLSMAESSSHGFCEFHQVLTLGSRKRKPSWRMIKCDIPHEPFCSGICINGSIYYQVLRGSEVPWDMKIVCFDVRRENFKLINKLDVRPFQPDSTLINYNGKLGALLTDGFGRINMLSSILELRVLVDAEKHEWSKLVSILPPRWKYVVGDAHLCFVGMVGTNEIVLSPYQITDPFYVVYYNFGTKAVRRVDIQGMEAFKNCRVQISLDYGQDVKFMQMVSA